MSDDPKPPRRISERVARMVEGAVERLGTEDLLYDIGMGGNDSGPVLVIGFWMPSPVLGQHIHVSAVVSDPPAVAQENIDRLIPSVLEALREERSHALKVLNGEALPRSPYTPHRELSLDR